MFYRKDCADMQLKSDQINESFLKQSKALLITGTGLSTAAMYETSMDVVSLARKTETLVVFDIDYRPVLWGQTTLGNGESRYKYSQQVSEVYQTFLPLCDLIVGTEEEICIAGGDENISRSLAKIRELTKAPIVIKLGDKGCTVNFSTPNSSLHSKPFPVEIVNVLGAGDGFMSGLLAGLLQGKSWEFATTYANASGALVVTRHGCAPAIPYQAELAYFIAHFDDNPLVWKSPELAQLHAGATKEKTPLPLIKNPNGFGPGLNRIVAMDDQNHAMGMSFSSIKLDKGLTYEFDPRYEFAALLITGTVVFHYSSMSTLSTPVLKQDKERDIVYERSDCFSQAPIVLHCPSACRASVDALSDCEILLIETENPTYFTPLVFDESTILESDNRGKDILEDTSYRVVRTVFDKRNRPESNLVVGEIISFQGRWSSYPSHYHAQPEIYHYRFSEPQGYAFAEHGKDALRIEHYDTYLIDSNKEHAHCTAPGYALYTLWFIRHLENNPYLSPSFRKEHEWTRTMAANNRVWNKK